jgi:FtsP/CotA-like multicopper oxidase with cupredoxin domain
MKSICLPRRAFLKSLPAGVAAGWAALRSGSSRAAGPGGGGCGGGGCGGGGSGTIDPPVGATFRDPIEAELTRPVDGVAEYDIEAAIAPININGTTANLMTYNGCFPGPTIRLWRGERLHLCMTNGLPPTTATNLLGYRRNITNLHTHGWHVSPEEPQDYVMYQLQPGESYDHMYDTMLQPGGTFCMYHPHGHGSVAEQFWAGLVGTLIVEDETDVLRPYETHLLVLKDISLSGNAPAPHATMMDYMHGKEGNVIMVNGQVNPRLQAKAGQVQRWRIVNASNARYYRIALDNHTLYLVGTDGGLLDKPYPRSELLLAPAERVDVLVKMTQGSGSYRFRALPYARMGMMTSPTITLMTVTYKGTLTQNLPTSVNSEATWLDFEGVPIVPIAAERELVLSMGQGQGYINGVSFDSGDPYTIMSRVGTYEVWTVRNASNMDHPFHQHVNAGQVLSVTGGDGLYTTIPAWKDCVNIPKGGSARLLVPVMDYPGMAMFHCHILEHEDIGMMGMWHLMGDGMPPM